MLINNSVYRESYVGNGVQTQFPVLFPFLQNAHLAVDLQNPTDTVPTRLTLNTHYTVTGAGAEAGGVVTLLTAPVTNAKLVIYRNVPYTQGYKYNDLGNFPAESHENALALLTMQCQQLQEQIDRSLTVTSTSGTDPSALIDSLLVSEANSTASAAAAAASAATATTSAADALTQANAALASANAAAAKLQELINAGMPVPIGMMAPFPVNSPPSGWAVVMGQTLQREVYPQAVTFLTGDDTTPSFTLPDLRGEFVRGADLGRGLDAGRAVGSVQGDAMRNITGAMSSVITVGQAAVAGAITQVSPVAHDLSSTAGGSVEYYGQLNFDASRVVPVAPEVRVHNVALVWCIKLVNHPVDVTQADINAVLAALNTMAQAVNPNNGKFSTVPVTHAPGQPLSDTVVATVLTTASATGPLIIPQLSGIAGWSIQESGVYRVELDLPVLTNITSYALLSVVCVRSGAEALLHVNLDGLPAGIWTSLKTTSVFEFNAGDDVFFKVQLIGASGTIHNAYGRATITRLR